MSDDFPTGEPVTINVVSPFIKKMKAELLQCDLYENFDNEYLYQVVEVIQGVITSRNNAEVAQQLSQTKDIEL